MTAVPPKIVPLRTWKWGVLPSYNGFDHGERVRGWQLGHWLADNGWAQFGDVCCVSGSGNRVSIHSENYYSAVFYPLCQDVHFALHKRFRNPDRWLEIVSRYALTGDEWFARLPLIQADLAGELRAEYGPEIGEIFSRAPVPRGVAIPHHQIFRAL